MAPRVDPVPSDETLPARVDVVIIGGGIIGASAALTLAQRGVSVLLCEKGEIAAEQSSRNWGWCRQQNRDARELPMATKSIDLWEQFSAESGEDACEDDQRIHGRACTGRDAAARSVLLESVRWRCASRNRPGPGSMPSRCNQPSPAAYSNATSARTTCPNRVP